MPRKKTAVAEAPASASAFGIELWTLEQVKPTLAAYNPRLISDRVLEDLKNNIQRFGFLLPVIINQRTNRMVGGHQRVKAAERLAIDQIPVRLVDLDEIQEKVLNLSLNKIEGKWDYSLLEEALTSVSDAGLLELTGFNETDLIEIMSGQEDEFEETFDEFNERLGQKRTQDFVRLRTSDGRVGFTCQKSAYDAFVHRMYTEVGVDDIAATRRFYQLIGLGE